MMEEIQLKSYIVEMKEDELRFKLKPSKRTGDGSMSGGRYDR